MELKIQTERVLKAAEKCSTVKGVLQELFPEAFECPQQKITKYPTPQCGEFNIEDLWAGTLIEKENQGKDKCKKYPTKSSNLFLTSCNGFWYNEEGEIVRGYLYYLPHK